MISSNTQPSCASFVPLPNSTFSPAEESCWADERDAGEAFCSCYRTAVALMSHRSPLEYSIWPCTTTRVYYVRYSSNSTAGE